MKDELVTTQTNAGYRALARRTTERKGEERYFQAKAKNTEREMRRERGEEREER